THSLTTGRCIVKTASRCPRVMAVWWCVAIALIVTGYSARPASAQVLYGSIVGTLTDQTGAGVPKATITVTNKSTGLKKEATTDDAGYYSIRNLPEGVYDLAITAGGFRPYTQKDLNVSINAVTRVDAAMQVGGLTEEVSVEASTALLQTTKSDVSVS